MRADGLGLTPDWRSRPAAPWVPLGKTRIRESPRVIHQPPTGLLSFAVPRTARQPISGFHRTEEPHQEFRTVQSSRDNILPCRQGPTAGSTVRVPPVPMAIYSVKLGPKPALPLPFTLK